jgi:prepilin-type processing-associated H-X9-DG protein
VVVAIIGVLVGILLPVFAHVRHSAREKTCANNLRQLLSAFSLYAADWGGHLVPVPLPDKPPREEQDVALLAAYAPYVSHREVWHCPNVTPAASPAEGESERIAYVSGLNTYYRSYTYWWLDRMEPGPCFGSAGEVVVDFIIEDSARYTAEGDPVAPHGSAENSRTNLGYVDGHIESMTLKERRQRWEELAAAQGKLYLPGHGP